MILVRVKIYTSAKGMTEVQKQKSGKRTLKKEEKKKNREGGEKKKRNKKASLQAGLQRERRGRRERSLNRHKSDA